MKRLLSLLCAFMLALGTLPLPAATAESATIITLNGTTASIAGGGALLSGQTIVIGESGEYRLSGGFTGQVLIDAAKDAEITLTLQGASIVNEQEAALLASSAHEVTIRLAEGTENSLISGQKRDVLDAESQPDENASGAAVQLKCDVKLTGDGSLFIGGYINQGLRTSKDLTVKSGSVTIEAVASGIRCKDEMEMKGGTMTITAGGNGIHAASAATDTEEEDGCFVMSGGEIKITSLGDAVQSDTTLAISGGALSAIVGGGSAAAPVHASDSRGMGAFMRWDMDSISTDDASVSRKGLKSEGAMSITGGVITVDAYDDALHSDSQITFSSGVLTLSSGDDGIHADNELHIEGGTLDILTSYEGLEAMIIDISGGDIRVHSADDGVNASGGSNGFDFGFDMGGKGSHGGRMQPGGFRMPGSRDRIAPGAPEQGDPAKDAPAAPPESANDAVSGATAGNVQEMPPAVADGTESAASQPSLPTLLISGGTLYVNADGDGLDSNGDLTVTGGFVIIDGPASSGNGALDSGTESGGSLMITGGTVLAIGASGMAECFGSGSTQPFIDVSLSWKAGDEIIVTAANGDELLRHTAAKSGQSIIFSSPSLREGDEVTVSCGGQTVTQTAGFTSASRGFGRMRW